MLVYGDAVRRIDCHEWQEKLREPPTPGTLLEQHAERVARLIEGGQIAQALADAAFREAGKRDLDNAKMQDILNVVLLLAQDVATSWKTGFHSIRETAAAPSAKLHLPPTVTGREPEGYAFYALYPEAFFEAAREARPPLGPSYVIGIRSIGTSLAAMVAAGWATQLLYSVRPRGHPFGREISSPDLMQRIARDENATVGIVDEGPGLSGSSFAAVVNGLRRAGIPDRAMRLYPSHFGLPGAESSSNSCAVFANIQRHIMPIEKLIIDTPIEAHRLAHWVEDLTGPALRPLIDISGGKWRELRNDPPARWPACDLQQERRKYILDSERGRFLLKFIGLGNVGVQKAALAQRLSASGFAPPFLGLRHGFTVERWIDAPSATPSTRGALLPFIARYLGYRSVHFRDAQMNGADLAALRDMAVWNTKEALGSAASERVASRLAHLQNLQGCRRIATDSRMHPHEWLCTPHGSFLKTDAVDHHAGHDLVGAQDVAWDLAGAIAAFGLDDAESEALCHGVEQTSGESVNRTLLSGLRLCQSAFEAGRLVMAMHSHAATPEHSRLKSAYAQQIERLSRLVE